MAVEPTVSTAYSSGSVRFATCSANSSIGVVLAGSDSPIDSLILFAWPFRNCRGSGTLGAWSSAAVAEVAGADTPVASELPVTAETTEMAILSPGGLETRSLPATEVAREKAPGRLEAPQLE